MCIKHCFISTNILALKIVDIPHALICVCVYIYKLKSIKITPSYYKLKTQYLGHVDLVTANITHCKHIVFLILIAQFRPNPEILFFTQLSEWWVWFGLVLCHINHCCLFNRKYCFYIYVKYMICKHILQINTVKWLNSSSSNNSI